MSTCREATTALEEALHLEELDEAHLAHAESCLGCGDRLARRRALTVLTQRARRAFEAEGDLPPSTWVRVRAGVDRAARPRWFGPGRAAWALGAVAAAAAAALLLSHLVWSDPAPQGEVAAVERGLAPLPAPVGVPSATTPSPAPAEDGLATAPAPPTADPRGVGEVLVTDEDPLTVRAFDRHTLALAPGTRVELVAWAPDRVSIALTRGTLTVEVVRATAGEVFEVHARDVLIEVVGTRFTVELGDEHVRVEVERGRLRVAHDGLETTVDAGGELRLPPEAAEEDVTQRPRPTPRPRVIDIEVPDQGMVGSEELEAVPSEDALRAIERATAAGQCEAALKALRALEGAVARGSLPSDRIAAIRRACPGP